jgi:hypothetical protein
MSTDALRTACRVSYDPITALKDSMRPWWKPLVECGLALRNRVMASTGLTWRSGDFRLAYTPDRGIGLFVTRDYAAGETLIDITGKPVSGRGEYTIQIGSDTHIYPDAPLRYANHSCEPNAGIRRDAAGTLRFHALRPIRRGDEMLWDYSMSERDLANAGGSGEFPCGCGAASCRGQVTGWRKLPAPVRQRYRDWAMPYLREEDAATGPD